MILPIDFPKAEKKDWDADERRFSGFDQEKNVFRRLSPLIPVY